MHLYWIVTELIYRPLPQSYKNAYKRSDVSARWVSRFERAPHSDGRFGSKVGQIGPQIGQIWDFFRSDEPNVLKFDLKNSRMCPIWGPI